MNKIIFRVFSDELISLAHGNIISLVGPGCPSTGMLLSSPHLAQKC